MAFATWWLPVDTSLYIPMLETTEVAYWSVDYVHVPNM